MSDEDKRKKAKRMLDNMKNKGHEYKGRIEQKAEDVKDNFEQDTDKI